MSQSLGKGGTRGREVDRIEIGSSEFWKGVPEGVWAYVGSTRLSQDWWAKERDVDTNSLG